MALSSLSTNAESAPFPLGEETAALVLSAGYGTRLGPLGKFWPKPLWPVGQKPLLSFALEFARYHNFSHLWANLHHQKDRICSYLSSLPFPVEQSIEEELLGSGGGIHQVLALSQQRAKRPTYLALLNSDQVVWFKDNPWPLLHTKVANARAALLAVRVQRKQGFNRLVVKDEVLADIKKFSEDHDGPNEYLTYLGIGLLRAQGLMLRPGQKSDFFQTVANFRQERVVVVEIRPEFYFDLGTLGHFWHSYWQILALVAQRPQIAFSKFLIDHKFINPSLLQFTGDKIFYGPVGPSANVARAANLTERPIQFKADALVFNDAILGIPPSLPPVPTVIGSHGIYCGDQFGAEDDLADDEGLA
ncbi:MAG: NTP transferase domain-containing protein [Bacteriovoracaceae bacterium]|nr:NTP transferase domain-containing protein [Bacteriovoracaceae bacterium]